MNSLKKHSNKLVLARSFFTLGLISIFYGISGNVNAQELLTRHVHAIVENGKASYLKPMLENKILRLDT